MAETKNYKGSCHCGNVRYNVDADLSGELSTCNCSICARNGWVLTFVPAEQFHLEEGENALTDYQFGNKTIHHLFCSKCGVRSFARGTMPDGTAMRAINVRCLEGVDVNTLNLKQFDGRSI